MVLAAESKTSFQLCRMSPTNEVLENNHVQQILQHFIKILQMLLLIFSDSKVFNLSSRNLKGAKEDQRSYALK